MLALCLAMLVSLCLAEVLLRALSVEPFRNWSPRYMHVPDDALGLVPAPDFVGLQETFEYSVEVRTNSLGLRSPEPIESSGPSVLLLGDSFAFGHGVEQEETSAYRLADELNRGRTDNDGTIQVHNAGVMSYGTRQSVERLRQLGPTLRPDLCILLFFVGNDPIDNVRELLDVQAGYVVSRGKTLPWWRRSQLVIKYRSSLYRGLTGMLPRSEIPGHCGNHTSFGFDLFRTTETPEVESAWNATRDALVELARTTESLECPLVLVAIPTRYQVEPTWWGTHRDTCGFDEEDFDLERVQSRLRDICSDMQVPYLDLLPTFRERAAQGPLYFRAPLDMHMNALAHEILAVELAAFLRERRLLPGA